MTAMPKAFFQTAYFVTDIERAAHAWNRLYGAGPFVLIPHYRMDTMTYRGRALDPSAFPDFSYAMGYLGDLMIQFTMQHDAGPSVYRDMYPAGGEGFHHNAYLLDDFEAEFARLEGLGIACGCHFTDGDVQGAYFDTRAATGAFTEIHSQPQHLLDAFAGWRRAHALLRPGDSPILRG